MKLEKRLDTIHAWTVHNQLLQLFTSCVRILIALPFVYSSIPKIMGEPFTLLPRSNPVGAYFWALYDTGYYYNFIGWSQLLAAVLLLIPRTSHIGALLFLPIIVNITVLTNAVGFKGTWLVTILMTVACGYLVCWDYPRWKSVLFSSNRFAAWRPTFWFVLIPFGLGAGGVILITAFGLIVGDAQFQNPRLLAAFFGLGCVYGMFVALHHRFMRFETADTGNTEVSNEWEPRTG